MLEEICSDVFDTSGKPSSINSEQDWPVNLKSVGVLIFIGQSCSASIEENFPNVSNAHWRTALSQDSSGWLWKRCKMFVHSICGLYIIIRRDWAKAASWIVFIILIFLLLSHTLSFIKWGWSFCNHFKNRFNCYELG